MTTFGLVIKAQYQTLGDKNNHSFLIPTHHSRLHFKACTKIKRDKDEKKLDLDHKKHLFSVYCLAFSKTNQLTPCCPKGETIGYANVKLACYFGVRLKTAQRGQTGKK